MTISMLSAARGLQVLGGLLALAAVLGAVIAPYCLSGLHAGLFAAGALLDVVSIASSRSAVAIVASTLKFLIVGSSLLVIAMCAPPRIGYEPILPEGVALTVGLASTIPSILGAFLLRFNR
jgi:hypothetical protein